MKISLSRQHLMGGGVIVMLVALFLFAAPYMPLGTDWNYVFGRFDFFWPYTPKSQLLFRNVPWTVLFLPHRWLSLVQGNAINMLLNIAVPFLVIVKLKGGWKAMALFYSFPFFLLLLWVNNIDWIPALIFILPSEWSAPIAVIKPQAVAGAYLIHAKRAWKKDGVLGVAQIGMPLVLVLGLSYVVWPGWFGGLTAPVYSEVINYSTLPIGLPFGVWLLWKAWRDDDEFLAATATVFFVPFVGVYSLSTVMLALVCKHPKAAFGLWLAVWLHYAVAMRPMFF